MAVPDAATDLAFTDVQSGEITFSWVDPNIPEVTPNVYGSSDGSTFSLLATLAEGVLSYTASNLSANTGYSFKIGLENVDGETLCDPISTTTDSITPITTTPTLGLTFNDLILRVAEYLGVADYSNEVAEIPTDAHDLDVCKRIVNDGYARFFNEYKWEFLNAEMMLEPDGINYIFDLPHDFQGEFLTTWTYPQTGPIHYMTETTEWKIRALRAGRETVGYPTLFAIRPKDIDETSTSARWQTVFWPTPDTNISVLTARYRRFPMKLTNLTDRSIAGPMHDQTVKQACLAAAEIQRYGESGPQEALYANLLSASVKRDVRNVPRSLGYNGDNSDGAGNQGRWPSNSVESYGGNPV